jgi:protein arginine N-methyltransferase 2
MILLFSNKYQAGSNKFFHDVYCQVAEIDLNDCGINTTYTKIPVPKEIMDPEVLNNYS